MTSAGEKRGLGRSEPDGELTRRVGVVTSRTSTIAALAGLCIWSIHFVAPHGWYEWLTSAWISALGVAAVAYVIMRFARARFLRYGA